MLRFLKGIQNMNIRDIKRVLNEQGKACFELAERLQSEGHELSDREKEMVRIAYYPIIAERTLFIKHAFLMNEIDDMKHNMDTIEEIINYLKC